MTLLRVLLKGRGIPEVPPPPTNVRVVQAEKPATRDDQILEALDPDNPYDWAVHGL